MQNLPGQMHIPLKPTAGTGPAPGKRAAFLADLGRRQTCDRKVVVNESPMNRRFEENNLNWDRIEGKWRQFTGAATRL